MTKELFCGSYFCVNDDDDVYLFCSLPNEVPSVRVSYIVYMVVDKSMIEISTFSFYYDDPIEVMMNAVKEKLKREIS